MREIQIKLMQIIILLFLKSQHTSKTTKSVEQFIPVDLLEYDEIFLSCSRDKFDTGFVVEISYCIQYDMSVLRSLEVKTQNYKQHQLKQFEYKHG